MRFDLSIQLLDPGRRSFTWWRLDLGFVHESLRPFVRSKGRPSSEEIMKVVDPPSQLPSQGDLFITSVMLLISWYVTPALNRLWD